jgi:ligand-binding SRPBCC domain-containing protein
LKILIKTAVEKDFQAVWSGFNQELLLHLSPPFPRAKITSFGMEVGNKVEIILDFFILRLSWISIITDSQKNENEIFFIDKGIKTPMGLTFWKHKHRIVKQNDYSLIIDEVEFKTKYKLLDWILYPLLFLQFVYRIPIYKSVFKKKQINQ